MTQAAIEGGSAECLAYVLAHRHLLPWEAAIHAATRGHLRCLHVLFAHSRTLVSAGRQPCCWDERVACQAAYNGHLDCVRFLAARGFRLGQNVAIAAIKGRQVGCLRFIIEQGCELTETLSLHAYQHDLECLQLLIQRGCPCDSAARIDSVYGGSKVTIALIDAV